MSAKPPERGRAASSGSIGPLTPRLRTPMYSMALLEGYLVWAKGNGAPTNAEWDEFFPFFKRNAVRARGWLAILAGGALTSVQRVQAVEVLTAAGCRFATVTVSPESRGSITAMQWGTGKGEDRVAATFAPSEFDHALDFIGATPKRDLIVRHLEGFVADVKADPQGLLPPVFHRDGR